MTAHAHGHKDLQKSHSEHRNAAIHAMKSETTPEGRHRAQLQVQQDYFDRAIADARADASLTKEQMLDGLAQLNAMFRASTDEIVAAVAHGV